MASIESQRDAGTIKLCALRLKSFFFEQMESEISSIKQIYKEVHFFLIMKSIFDIDDKVGVGVLLIDSSQKF